MWKLDEKPGIFTFRRILNSIHWIKTSTIPRRNRLPTLSLNPNRRPYLSATLTLSLSLNFIPTLTIGVDNNFTYFSVNYDSDALYSNYGYKKWENYLTDCKRFNMNSPTIKVRCHLKLLLLCSFSKSSSPLDRLPRNTWSWVYGFALE